MPTITTRTLNPLPFEALEPRRFEDLVRQLAYDFKLWRQLEATGRTGSDEGFDARGFEIISAPSIEPVLDDQEEQEAILETDTDRLWLIQCKRERSIGPSKMQNYLDDIHQDIRADIYGILFVAACDFSKKTRDTFRSWCLENGISECHVWGKGELEDLLYLPKNDHLLFAYFNISLQFRKRKISTQVRRTTTLKRKLKRLFPADLYRGTSCIIRDISDERYPYNTGILESSDKLWRVVYAKGIGVHGLKILYKSFYAYGNHQTGQWDISTLEDYAVPHPHEHPWRDEDFYSDGPKTPNTGHELWVSLPERFQFNAHMIYEIRYDEIIEIDDVGDAVSDLPTIYVNFAGGRIPFLPNLEFYLDPVQRFAERIFPKIENHVRFFPDEARNLSWEREWCTRNEFSLSTEPFETTLEVPPWLQELKNLRDKPS